MTHAGATAPLRLVVMGVSGGDKSIVASALAGRFGLVFVDGDDIHPPANVVKMRSGVPLDDADLWPWLDRVAATLRCPSGVVVACSPLKRACRDRIRGGTIPGLRFVLLDIAPEKVRARLQAGPEDFTPPTPMEGRFAALEHPGADEADVLTVAAGRPVHDIADEISGRLAARTDHGAGRHG